MKSLLARPTVILPIALAVALAALTFALPLATDLDAQITHLVQSLPPHLDGFMDGIATLATYPYLIAAAVIWAVVETSQRHWARAVIIIAGLSAQLLFYAIKELTRRARPVSDFVQSHGLHDYSYPSGHAAGSAAVFGLIALVSFEILPRRMAVALSIVMLVLIVTIGIGRIYLGAHFPTDVLAGWLIGLLTISILRPVSLRYMPQRTTKP